MVDETFIAGYGNGSWGGDTKYHACDPNGKDARTGRYTSRCGQRYMIAALDPPDSLIPFDRIMHLEQCQRCVKYRKKDREQAEKFRTEIAERLGSG